MTSDVKVACSCPGTPHPDGDTVTLHPSVTLPIGVAAMSVIRSASNVPDIEAGLAGVYLRHGIAAWTFVDADGRPVPITPPFIAAYLPWPESLTVAEAADALYSEAVMAPLARKTSKSSPPGPTELSTSPSPSTGPTPLAPSRRSSRNATAGTPSEVPAP